LSGRIGMGRAAQQRVPDAGIGSPNGDVCLAVTVIVSCNGYICRQTPLRDPDIAWSVTSGL
jgi:hypothetical protein